MVLANPTRMGTTTSEFALKMWEAAFDGSACFFIDDNSRIYYSIGEGGSDIL
jgi:hypothetical protein